MIHVIYHKNCRDGFGAALAAWMVYGEDANYIRAQYGDEPPPMIAAGDDVYILDFSYPRQQLTKMIETARRIVVLDHHKTAAASLAGLRDPGDKRDERAGLFAHFDMGKSGAVMAWEYFHGDMIPPLMRYLQDRDLWQWALPDSREVSAGVDILPWDFTEWLPFVDNVEPLKETGRTVLTYQRKLVNQACGATRWETIGGKSVPVVNTGTLISEVCEQLLKDLENAPFAACRFDLVDKRVYSLRSRDGSDVDVSEIAKQYGGGGHKHSAGFTAPIA